MMQDTASFKHPQIAAYFPSFPRPDYRKAVDFKAIHHFVNRYHTNIQINNGVQQDVLGKILKVIQTVILAETVRFCILLIRDCRFSFFI